VGIFGLGIIYDLFTLNEQIALRRSEHS